MTPDVPLPTNLRRWLRHHLPGLDTATDVSWPRGSSQVWRVASGTTEAYVKLDPTEEGYTREIRAHRHATRFAPHEVPRLIAADRDMRALLTSPVAGLVVRGLTLPAATEALVHEHAGRLLRRWHSLPEPVTVPARDAIAASVAAQASEASLCLELAADHLSDAQCDLVRRVSVDLPALAEKLPVVYRHGDFSPRNWLWDNDNGAFGLIDFEEADHGVAVEDLVWLHGAIWPTRPDLRNAFLSGYGRELSADEQIVLRLFTARLAVSYLTTGITKDDGVLIDRGRTALDHLAEPEQ